MGFDIYDAFQDETQTRQMKLSLTIIAAIILSSCVSIPIPPTGQNQGKLGSIKLAVSYVPYQNPDREADANVVYAWQHFSKTIKDK
jgi:hypothetical protein